MQKSSCGNTIVFYVSVKLRTTHSIGIILKRGGAELARARVPRRDDAPGEGALVVGSGTVVVGVISGETPAANLPKWAVVLIVVGRLLVALETVGKWSGGARALTFVGG